jgi:hypothetical protein
MVSATVFDKPPPGLGLKIATRRFAPHIAMSLWRRSIATSVSLMNTVLRSLPFKRATELATNPVP